MSFSKELPTEQGWYWVRPKEWVEGFSGCQIVKVCKAKDTPLINTFTLDDTDLAYSGINWKWWEPLTASCNLYFGERIESPPITMESAE